jgi:3D (Asp-Asp-Asp) domain-containing protein
MRRRIVFLALAAVLLHGCAAMRREGPSKKERELTVTAYAYNSTRAQTDGRPRETASGHDLEPGMKVIAVSRDLEEKGLTLGTKVHIEGLPGTWTVLDRMNAESGGPSTSTWARTWTRPAGGGSARSPCAGRRRTSGGPARPHALYRACATG